jgi:hypothetical protein
MGDGTRKPQVAHLRVWGFEIGKRRRLALPLFLNLRVSCTHSPRRLSEQQQQQQQQQPPGPRVPYLRHSAEATARAQWAGKHPRWAKDEGNVNKDLAGLEPPPEPPRCPLITIYLLYFVRGHASHLTHRWAGVAFVACRMWRGAQRASRHPELKVVLEPGTGAQNRVMLRRKGALEPYQRVAVHPFSEMIIVGDQGSCRAVWLTRHSLSSKQV